MTIKRDWDLKLLDERLDSIKSMQMSICLQCENLIYIRNW